MLGRDASAATVPTVNDVKEFSRTEPISLVEKSNISLIFKKLNFKILKFREYCLSAKGS